MARYSLRIKRSAAGEIESLGTRGYRRRILDRLLELGEVPYSADCRWLSGTGKVRLQLGSHSVLYRVDEGSRQVVILAVADRSVGRREGADKTVGGGP